MEYRKGYTKICQFDENLLLNPLVVSDHAEIVAQTNYGNIAAWNISNPEHHHYFGSTPTGSFAKTHLPPTYEGYQQFIQNKINNQLNYIIDSFIKGYISIWIIIEGYHSFYEELKRRLNGLNYLLVYDDIPDPDNNSAILINNNVFTLIISEIFIESYFEEFDRAGRRPRKFRVPVAYLQTYDQKILVVGAVHIPGSNRRQPITGMNFLNNIIQHIIDQNDNNFAGFVLMGDFNSIPSFVGKYIKAPKILLSDYPTHVNPGTETSFYDMTLVYKLDINILPREYTSIYTQALIESIDRSCRQYLSLHS